MIEKTTAPTLTIRRLHPADDGALKRLAQLDSGSIPPAPVLGAVVGGRLLAAISLESGQPVADPFSHTAELRTVLELRAAQLRDHGPARAELSGGDQCCSSGAIVRPDALSCSQ